MPTNETRAMLLRDEPAYGITLTAGAPVAGEVLAQAGFDFIMVDNQHGLWNETGTMLAFRSIVLGGATPMLRVQKNDYYTIGRALDSGALGVIVPMVNSVEDAQEAARAVRYPPRGQRSIGPFGASFHGADYLQWINDEVYLSVQIESITAAERAEAILGVEGVDGCWVGPADLAASMGLDLTVQADRARHEETILQVLEACRKAGKVPGIAGRPHDAKDWVARGMRFVTVGSDGMLLTDGATAILADLR
jgi:4-hydroxy-2-oxoheptanedioate aldolase